MDASIRNALGDIGNRIGLGNVQFGALNKNDVPNVFAKPIAPNTLRIDEIKQQQTLKFTKTSSSTASAIVTSSTATTSLVQQQQHIQKKEEKPDEEPETVCIEIDQSCTNDVELESEVEDESNDDDEEVFDEDEEEEEEVQDEENDEDNDIIDIDAFDDDNPQLCTTYVHEIYAYLTHMERKLRVSPQFLQGKVVTAKMRSVLIDWLIQVHVKFHLLQETMYLCVNLIDAYLERVDVSKINLQLVGVTAMFLASKYEEMYVPAIEDFVYMTDNTYTKSEIRLMEISICKTLNFEFGKPLPLHFLRRFSKAGQADPKQHTLAKYFMELTIHDAEFASMDPSYLAASSLYLSFKLLNGPEWNKTMEYYSSYHRSVLWSGMQKIAKLVLKASEPEYKYRAAFNKYASSKSMRISIIPELSDKLIKEVAAGQIS